MKHYNVTLAEVMNVTRNMNQNANGGVIYEYGNEYIVRGVLSSHDVAQLSRSVIKTVEGVPVTLEDIADVKIGCRNPNWVLLRREETCRTADRYQTTQDRDY